MPEDHHRSSLGFSWGLAAASGGLVGVILGLTQLPQ
jgi:hypothetical protein